MRNGRATLVPRIALAKVGPAPKNCIVTNKPLQHCMSSTFFGQRPLSCVTGYVNTNLSCSWLGFNLVVFSTCCCDWLFPARCIWLGAFPQGAFSICIKQVSETLFIQLKPQCNALQWFNLLSLCWLSQSHLWCETYSSISATLGIPQRGLDTQHIRIYWDIWVFEYFNADFCQTSEPFEKGVNLI